MKQLIVAMISLLLASPLFGQVAGNINYQTQVRFQESNIQTVFQSDAELLVTVKGLANVKADTYVAIFNVTQMGKTAEEVSKLIDERIRQATAGIKAKPGVELYVDMLSFVPIYEYEVEKKLFSKKTYNEVPAGFEVKKNLHIQYTNPELLNELIALLATAEIYDLVRVDYFSNQIEATKKALMAQAHKLLQEKLQHYQNLLPIELDSADKQVTDGYRVVLPVEMYKSYQAYSSSSLSLGKSASAVQADKSTVLYYQPILDKEFDFVLNPTILEPVIQVLYEVKLKVRRKDPTKQPSNKYYLITPSGELKAVELRD
jgi:uncharacterized protein YggE